MKNMEINKKIYFLRNNKLKILCGIRKKCGKNEIIYNSAA